MNETDFQRAIAHGWPAAEWRDVHVLAAVSGGADSVALLRSLAALKRAVGGEGRLIAAHFNHGLRGPASDADAAWVEDLCRRLGIACETGRAATTGDGELANDSELAARDARYAFLTKTAQQTGARYVTTGHTLDDQVETVLHRLFRGTGLAGLAGIPSARALAEGVTLVRPLLSQTRDQIESYLRQLCQDYRHDQTNDDPRYTRNWIRHELLPLIQDRTELAAAPAILGLSQQAAQTQAWIDDQAQQLVQGAFDLQPSAGSIRIRTKPLSPQPLLLVREACRQAWRGMGWPEQAMGRAQWDQLAQQVVEPSVPEVLNLPGDVRAERQANTLLLSRPSCPAR